MVRGIFRIRPLRPPSRLPCAMTFQHEAVRKGEGLFLPSRVFDGRRRCTEQSRSRRCTMCPWLSARIMKFYVTRALRYFSR